MNQKQENSNFAKAFGIFLVIVLLLTFFSKSIYNYRLPVVTASLPKQGILSFTVEETTEVSYSQADSIYADVDGRVKEILVQAGDEVEKGQSIMQLERMDDETACVHEEGMEADFECPLCETEKRKDILAEKSGIITYVGVKKGMYVSSVQNIILYEIAEKSEEWTVAVFITDEQGEYVDMESTASVEVENVPEGFVGEVCSIVPYAEQGRAGYLARITFFSEDMEIAGKLARVTIRKDSPQYDTLIPEAALHKDASGYYVLVLKEDDSVLGNGYAAYRMSVDLLDSDTVYCAVRGLPADEKVIESATGEITNGSKVYYEGEGGE